MSKPQTRTLVKVHTCTPIPDVSRSRRALESRYRRRLLERGPLSVTNLLGKRDSSALQEDTVSSCRYPAGLFSWSSNCNGGWITRQCWLEPVCRPCILCSHEKPKDSKVLWLRATSLQSLFAPMLRTQVKYLSVKQSEAHFLTRSKSRARATMTILVLY